MKSRFIQRGNMETFKTLLLSCLITLTSSTDQATLEARVNFLESQYKQLLRDTAFASQYCATLKSNPCGPCKCMDDRRVLEKFYCDCQNFEPKRDCLEHKQSGVSVSGIYKVHQLNLKIIQVFCDQTTDGGGWIVVQRRVDGTETFYRDWEFYENGFGYLQHEHWLGNANLYTLILQSKFGKGSELRVELMKQDGTQGYAKYNFQIGDHHTQYRLHLSGYSGNATDSFSSHNGMMFTTIDRDNDVQSGSNCAVTHNGGWWFINCFNVNLNGKYFHPGQTGSDWRGIVWYPFNSHVASDSLRRTEMKIRRKF